MKSDKLINAKQTAKMSKDENFYNKMSKIASNKTSSLQMAINDKEESKDHQAAVQHQSTSQTVESQS